MYKKAPRRYQIKAENAKIGIADVPIERNAVMEVPALVFGLEAETKRMDPSGGAVEALQAQARGKVALATGGMASAHCEVATAVPANPKAIESGHLLQIIPLPEKPACENVAQAARFVDSGAADVGIIAKSLALAPAMRSSGRFWDVPEDTYTPLQQGGLILPWAVSRDAALRVRDYLLSDTGTQTQPARVFAQEAASSSSVSATYASADDRWRVQAYAKNLENKEALTAVITINGLNYGYLTEPRTYGVRASFKF